MKVMLDTNICIAIIKHQGIDRRGLVG